MRGVTFTFRVDKALKTEFSSAAKARDRSAAQLCGISCAILFDSKRTRPRMMPGSVAKFRWAWTRPMPVMRSRQPKWKPKLPPGEPKRAVKWVILLKVDQGQVMKIESAEKTDYQQLIEIWESSVRATHDFLTESDLIELRSLILDQYFKAVDLSVVRSDEGELLGFCGVSDGNIEMLFIAPKARGMGIGTLLTQHAISVQGATRVDVNEQNEQALGFYKHRGFEVIGRSPLDGQGKPYPLLHMQLAA